MATMTTVYERKDSLVTRDLAGEKIIVPVRGKVGDLNCIYTLNTVANEIWQLLDGKRSIAEIVKQLGREYEVDEARLTTDVLRVTNEMREENLVMEKA